MSGDSGLDQVENGEMGNPAIPSRSPSAGTDIPDSHRTFHKKDMGANNQLGLDGHHTVDLGSDGEEEGADLPYITRATHALHLADDMDLDLDQESTPTRPPYLTPQTHLLRPDLPSPTSSPTTAIRKRLPIPIPPSRRPLGHSASSSISSSSSFASSSSRPNIVPLDLPSSASEIFGSMRPPPLARQATYSSLPPSPILDKDFAVPEARGLGIKEMEDVLGILSSSLPAEGLGMGVDEGDPWHTAESRSRSRSRRSTLGEVDGELARSRVPSGNSRKGKEAGPDPDALPTLGRADGPGTGSSEEEREQLRRRAMRASSPGAFESLAELRQGGSSLWDILSDEGGAEDWEAWVVDGKWGAECGERIANFLAIPLAIERVTIFGALLCLDGFLYNFTILPIRATFATIRIIRRRLAFQSIYPIPPSHISSLLRLLLLVIPSVFLLLGTDTSKMYHSVRGQDTIKLYVIFNALEIADRLCGAFGQDVLDTLFARDTLAPLSHHRPTSRKREKARPYFFFALSLGYVLAHTLIFFYMLVSLNVAINSYDYTLLSLLISNQFVEIKGSVFKKFEKENLFQILCADIVERFQLSLMLSVIAVRNMIEMAGSDLAFLPKSFIKGKNLFDSIASPLLFVIVSEMLVDWLKHAFITKFNHVRASVYGRYMDVLAKDVMLAGSFGRAPGDKPRTHPLLLDQSPLVARRLGFASIPLACLVIRIGAQAIGMLTGSHYEHGTKLSVGDYAWLGVKWTGLIILFVCGWACLVALKVLLGLSLLSYSAIRESGMEQREAEDSVNDFGRTAVAENKDQTEYNKRTAEYLSSASDDMPEYASPSMSLSPSAEYRLNIPTQNGIHDPGSGLAGGKSPSGQETPGKRKKWKLEEVERWTMVKRIW